MTRAGARIIDQCEVTAAVWTSTERDPQRRNGREVPRCAPRSSVNGHRTGRTTPRSPSGRTPVEVGQEPLGAMSEKVGAALLREGAGCFGGGCHDVDGFPAGVQQARAQQQQESFGIALVVDLDGLVGPV